MKVLHEMILRDWIKKLRMTAISEQEHYDGGVKEFYQALAAHLLDMQLRLTMPGHSNFDDLVSNLVTMSDLVLNPTKTIWVTLEEFLDYDYDGPFVGAKDFGEADLGAEAYVEVPRHLPFFTKPESRVFQDERYHLYTTRITRKDTSQKPQDPEMVVTGYSPWKVFRTECFPAKWQVKRRDGKYASEANATHNFFRTLVEAVAEANKRNIQEVAI